MVGRRRPQNSEVATTFRFTRTSPYAPPGSPDPLVGATAGLDYRAARTREDQL